MMESGTGALPGFKCWRAAVNSLCEKMSEIFTGSGVGSLQKSDTALSVLTDNRSTASFLSFLISGDAIASAEMGQEEEIVVTYQ